VVDIASKMVIGSKFGGGYVFSHNEDIWISTGLCLLETVPRIENLGMQTYRMVSEPLVLRALEAWLNEGDVDPNFHVAMRNLNDVISALGTATRFVCVCCRCNWRANSSTSFLIAQKATCWSH
jgi:hypothetical protein